LKFFFQQTKQKKTKRGVGDAFFFFFFSSLPLKHGQKPSPLLLPVAYTGTGHSFFLFYEGQGGNFLENYRAPAQSAQSHASLDCG
jgi:hypothetical protein